LFLYYLENLVGSEVFRKILQVYIQTFRLKSVNYTDFKNIFETQVEVLLGTDKAQTIIMEVDWVHWVHQSGLPNKKFDYSNL
jgi:aminopeptidase N